MTKDNAIVVLGTFDSKGEEHLFLKERIEARGLPTLTVNVGTHKPSPFTPDKDFFPELQKSNPEAAFGRDEALAAVGALAEQFVRERYYRGEMGGIISAGGGTGTYVGTRVMRALPFGVPKIMVSTVASRDMASIVSTKDITMMHSVADIMGVNTILGGVLDKAAAAVCAMAGSRWQTADASPRIALTMFGFITEAAERIKGFLEEEGYEVIPFHANGTGGMAMEELAVQGYFQGILDLATHELADELKQGYCSGIGPGRLHPPGPLGIPRLVVPGGLDCAVLEFTRETVPEAYRDRKIFFYDFRSAIGLDLKETLILAAQMVEKLNACPENVRLLIPMGGWSEADRDGEPLGDPGIRAAFVEHLSGHLNPKIPVETVEGHINDADFSRLAADSLHKMIKERSA